MGETGNDLLLLDVNPGQSSQESALSGEEMLNLVSRLLDSELDKKFSEFKRGLEQKELATDSQIKKLKTEEKAANSFQFKGNKLQFEFNSSLLDSIDSASASLLEGNLTRVNQELENVKTLLNKRSKAIRSSWLDGSDELADDSEDEKKLHSAERRALSKLRARKQNRSTSHLILPGVIALLVSLFRPQQFPQQSFRGHQPFRSRQPQLSDKCFACGQFRHWANSRFCPNFSHWYSSRALPSSSTATANKQ